MSGKPDITWDRILVARLDHIKQARTAARLRTPQAGFDEVIARGFEAALRLFVGVGVRIAPGQSEITIDGWKFSFDAQGLAIHLKCGSCGARTVYGIQDIADASSVLKLPTDSCLNCEPPATTGAWPEIVFGKLA